ncbi:MAG: hypothetical protein WC123_03045 [Bacilli bacterium]
MYIKKEIDSPLRELNPKKLVASTSSIPNIEDSSKDVKRKVVTIMLLRSCIKIKNICEFKKNYNVSILFIHINHFGVNKIYFILIMTLKVYFTCDIIFKKGESYEKIQNNIFDNNDFTIFSNYCIFVFSS